MLRTVFERSRRASARGISIVELLVGLALGLFVVGGGLLMLAGFTDDNRRLLLETRLNQDLRAASDMITRDLRRAGYWDQAHTGVWAPGAASTLPRNPYGQLAAAACGSATLTPISTGAVVDSVSATTGAPAVCFAIQAAVDPNPAAIDANERFGYELNAGVISAVVDGAAASPLTDPKTITVTDLVITRLDQIRDASSICTKSCVGLATCPRVAVVEFEVLIRGELPGDASVSRSLRSNVRVRNDFLGGQCPV